MAKLKILSGAISTIIFLLLMFMGANVPTTKEQLPGWAITFGICAALIVALSLVLRKLDPTLNR